MSVKVEQITESLILGEGPHWDEYHQALFFVDIRGQAIHKYVPTTKEHTKTKLDGRVGFIIPVDGTTDQYLVGLERKFVVVQWDGKNDSGVKVVKELFEVDENTKNRINDGKADPRGRVFAGTMGYEEPIGNVAPEAGSLFRLDGSRQITKVADRIGVSNGLAWDVSAKAFYYIDSEEKKIRRYDYDVETGEISNMTYIFHPAKHGIHGFPDGMTIDTDGNIWLAVFESCMVCKLNPKNGEVLQKIPIPADQVTSVTFGGANYDELYVTTANMSTDPKESLPGCTFVVTGLGVKGLPNVNFKL